MLNKSIRTTVVKSFQSFQIRYFLKTRNHKMISCVTPEKTILKKLLHYKVLPLTFLERVFYSYLQEVWSLGTLTNDHDLQDKNTIIFTSRVNKPGVNSYQNFLLDAFSDIYMVLRPSMSVRWSVRQYIHFL